MIKKIGCVQHDCAECVAREQDLVEKLKSAALQSYAIGYKDAQSGDKMQLAQPERPWVELTDAEIQDCYNAAYRVVQGRRLEVTFARAIGVKLKEKNT